MHPIVWVPPLAETSTHPIVTACLATAVKQKAFDEIMRWARLREAAVLNRKRLAARRVPRKLLLDSQMELQSLMARVEKEARNKPRSTYLANLHAKMMSPTKANDAIPLLELLESEIRPLPSPCTRKHIQEALSTIEKVLPAGVLDKEMHECLMLLALQRKLPAVGGKRGSKAVPIGAPGLWYQVLHMTEERYLTLNGFKSPAAGINYPGFVPQLMHLLGVAAASAGVAGYALEKRPQADTYVPGSAKETPPLKLINPVALWLESTYVESAESSADVLPTWCASVTLHCTSAEQCLELVRQLTTGVEAELNGELLTLTLLDLHNRYQTSNAHPLHLRSQSLHMLVTGDRCGSEPVLVEIQHDAIMNLYETSNLSRQYDFFWERVVIMSKHEFERKLESLLVFLVEAISVPVLLSLLLLTYSSTTSSKGITMDLNELPDSRHELYKMGIFGGIVKRMAIELNQTNKDKKKSAEAADHADDDEEKETNQRRVKRKSTLEQNLGNALGGGAGSKDDGASHASNGPMIDLNSVLRGKKVRQVVGADEVGLCYSLIVRVLDKSKHAGFDLRSGIVSVVPKSHTLYGVVTAFVEYVLTPPTRTEQAWQDVRSSDLAPPHPSAERLLCVARLLTDFAHIAGLQENAAASGCQQPGKWAARVYIERCGVRSRHVPRGAEPLDAPRPRRAARRRTRRNAGDAIRQGTCTVSV